MPPPGYYADPTGSGLLRWWDGQQWTTAVVQPPPVAAPQPVQPVQPRAFPVVASVLPMNAVATGGRFGSDRTKAIIAGAIVVVVASALGFAALPDGGSHPVASETIPQPTAQASTPAPTVSPRIIRALPQSQPPSRGKPVVTVAEARQVVLTYWSRHQALGLKRDYEGLRRLQTAGAAVYEPVVIACGCRLITTTVPLERPEYFVPRQTRYPASFMVEGQSYDDNSSWAQVLVFTKAGPAAQWKVAENSRFSPGPAATRLGDPLTGPGGFVTPPTKAQHRRATLIAGQLARLWQQTKDTGRVPDQAVFLNTGETARRLNEIAASPQNHRHRNGLYGRAHFSVDPRDPLVESNDDGVDIACQSIRETITYWAGPGYVVYQDPGQERWGPLLPPGDYRTVTKSGAWQTCFRLGQNPRTPVEVWDQDIAGGRPIGVPVSGPAEPPGVTSAVGAAGSARPL